MHSNPSKFTQKLHALVSVVMLASFGLSLCVPLITFAQEDGFNPDYTLPYQPPVFGSDPFRNAANQSNWGMVGVADLTPPIDVEFGDNVLPTSFDIQGQNINPSTEGGLAASQNNSDTRVEWGCNPFGGVQWSIPPLSPPKFKGCFSWLLYTGMEMAQDVMIASGRLLNVVMGRLVIEMSGLVGTNQGAGSALRSAWGLLRDVANVFLVFITIFIGLSMIVGATSFGSKRMLFKVVLAALFVNFSYTLATIVIDTSNLLTIGIYSELMEGECVSTGIFSSLATAEPCINMGVAGKFADALDIQTLLDKGALGETGENNTITVKDEVHELIWWISILGIVMFLVLAFIFIATAGLVFMRFFMLIFLLVLSPVGLVAWITGVSGLGRRWWKALLDQSFFLPVMALMWLLSLRLLEGMKGVMFESGTTYAGLAGAMGGVNGANPSFFGLLIFFMLVIGALIYSLVLAKTFGAIGANVAINTGDAWAKKAGMVVGGATVGMAARVGRNTLGRAASNGARNDELMRQSVEGNWAQRKIAAGRLKMHDKIASSSFDARALAGKDAQKWIGEGKKGGYTQKTKDEQKRIEEVHKRLGEAKTTGDEQYARDKKMDVVESDHATLAKVGEGGTEWERKKAKAVVQRLEQEAQDAKKREEALSGQDEVNRAQKALDAVPNEKQLEAMEKKHSELKSEAFMPGADAKKMQAYEDSRKALESARNSTSQRDALEKQLEQAKSNSAVKKQSAEYKKAKEEADLATTVYSTADKHYTAGEELKRLKESGASGIEIQNQRKQLEDARLSLDTIRSQRGAAVDAEFMSKAKDRANARQEAFLNNESNRLFGRKHREFTTTLRKKTGKAARNEEMEKLFKKWKEEEEGTTPSAPSSTTPTAPTATTTT